MNVKHYIFLVDAQHFCAGGTVDKDKVTKVAPIIRYMIGWNADEIKSYCEKKNWILKIYPLDGK